MFNFKIIIPAVRSAEKRAMIFRFLKSHRADVAHEVMNFATGELRLSVTVEPENLEITKKVIAAQFPDATISPPKRGTTPRDY
jgi:hypothetical protein